jgi:hypothetical protein
MNTNASSRTNNNKWLRLARYAWFVLTALLLVIFIAGLSPRYDELSTICRTDACIPIAPTPEDAAALTEIGFSLQLYSLINVLAECVIASSLLGLAILLFWRNSSDWMSLLVSAAFVMLGLNFMVEADLAFFRINPPLLPLFELLTALAGIPFAWLFFLFPNGAFVPRWTRWIAIALLVAALIDPLFRLAGYRTQSEQSSSIGLVVYLLGLFIGFGAQVYRYRRVSNSLERQQTKWVLLGMGSLLIANFVWSYFVDIAPPAPGYPRVIFNVFIQAALLPLIITLPVTLFISVMRYRLWDIDIIIRKTLLYGLLTAILAAVYLVSVIVIHAGILALSGSAQQSQLAIVLSTLAIAALFSPLRRNIQVFIDRRFYRKKYNVEQILKSFAVSIRDDVDLDRLSSHLLTTVHQTMQPENLSLWLRRKQ